MLCTLVTKAVFRVRVVVRPVRFAFWLGRPLCFESFKDPKNMLLIREAFEVNPGDVVLGSGLLRWRITHRHILSSLSVSAIQLRRWSKITVRLALSPSLAEKVSARPAAKQQWHPTAENAAAAAPAH
jgi:hypothetical protein